ncbi:YggT family protein [Granulicatella balaenopterae]|uniref:YggT family protein n=2 Tax=Granulicatella balaenopterae TaxID=137733 RepID=A0A1H9IC19_9LACT|nr:YggT family protein [Granulicatella balaenopterae]
MTQVLMTIYRLCNLGIEIYSIMLMAYALLSWFPGAYSSALGQWLIKMCQPYVDYFERLIPSFGGVSFSVVFALLFLQLVGRGIYVIFSLLM